MKQYFVLLLVGAGAMLTSSCIKSTSSSEYDSVWRPYGSTVWSKPSAIENFSAADGGFSFDATISSSNAVDTLGLKLTFIPSMYVISNIETANAAQFTISAAITSQPDSMKLKTAGSSGALYTFYQFGSVRGIVRTYGKDSVLTAPRAFTSGTLYSYTASLHPDSCGAQLNVQLILNWNLYTGAAVIDTLKTTKVSVRVKNMGLTVTGVDIQRDPSK